MTSTRWRLEKRPPRNQSGLLSWLLVATVIVLAVTVFVYAVTPVIYDWMARMSPEAIVQLLALFLGTLGVTVYSQARKVNALTKATQAANADITQHQAAIRAAA
jgi:hypothetical protein